MISILIPCKREPDIAKFLAETEYWFPKAQIIVSSDRHGKGKGWALRQALPFAKHDLIVFIDGDGEIPPRMIHRLLPFIHDYDIVVGRKQVRGLVSRRFLTLCSRLYIWLLFGINYDTQTGIKLFRKKAISPWKADSFAFDIEILARANMEGKKIIEVPVEVTGSKPMAFKSVWKCLVESFKIHNNPGG